MSDDTVALIRGFVYNIEYTYNDGEVAPKFALCLQEGKICANTNTVLMALLTTKNTDRVYSWEVKLSPEEAKSEVPVKIILGYLIPIRKSDITGCAYQLSEATMKEVDQRLLLSVGLVKVEDVSPHG